MNGPASQGNTKRVLEKPLEKPLSAIVTAVGHKTSPKWVPRKRHRAPGGLYLGSRGNLSNKKGPTEGKPTPSGSTKGVLENRLVKIVTDLGCKMGAKRDAKGSLFGDLTKCKNCALV